MNGPDGLAGVVNCHLTKKGRLLKMRTFVAFYVLRLSIGNVMYKTDH
jgi:hypothetical protein